MTLCVYILILICAVEISLKINPITQNEFKQLERMYIPNLQQFPKTSSGTQSYDVNTESMFLGKTENFQFSGVP